MSVHGDGARLLDRDESEELERTHAHAASFPEAAFLLGLRF